MLPPDCDHRFDTKRCCGKCDHEGAIHTHPAPKNRSESMIINGKERLVYVGRHGIAAVELDDDLFVCGTYRWEGDVGFVANEDCMNYELFLTVEQKLERAHG